MGSSIDLHENKINFFVSDVGEVIQSIFVREKKNHYSMKD
jgi:hypothetical protein